MRKNRLVVVLAVGMVLAVAAAGCAQKPKSANSSEAIQQAKQLESVEAQVNYLIREANAFISSQQFDEAVNTAR